MKRIVDRGTPTAGVNRTQRDHRVPQNEPRKLENVTLRDGRIKRRKGIQQFSTKRFNEDCLMKGTQNDVVTQRFIRVPGEPGLISTAPLSYGLLRWHDDFQPRSDRDWTIEMFLVLGDTSELFTQRQHGRLTKYLYGTGSPSQRFLRQPNVGVYAYDQSVTANWLNIPDDQSIPTGDFDTFSVTSLAVSYTATSLFVTFDLWDSVNSWYNKRSIQCGHNGSTAQVAIVYSETARVVSVYIDGGNTPYVYTLGAAEQWAGEVDYINGASNVPIKRDIVLLNEYTVRGAMASTCKIHPTNGVNAHETLFSYDTEGINDIVVPNYLNLSPPRGAGMSELRFWHEARSLSDIRAYAFSRLPSGTVFSGLKGYWHLNDGGPVCVERLGPSNIVPPRVITLHHGYPGFSPDSAMPNGIAMRFADGQFVKKSYNPRAAAEFIEDSYTNLLNIFHPGTNYDEQHYAGHHDFTVMMRIRAPHDFGQEINGRPSDAAMKDVWFGTSGKQELARGTQTNQPHAILTGNDNLLGASTSWYVRNPFVADDAGGTKVYHRSFDQTLWSVEAATTPREDDISNNTRFNTVDARRVALARGMLTPEGRVAFEFFGWDAVSGFSREFRLVSEDTLDPSEAVTLTFRKRTLTRLVGGSPNQAKSAYGFALEIFFGQTMVGQIRIGGRQAGDDIDLSGSVGNNPATSPLNSGTMPHAGVTDILVGSSYVNDTTERGLIFSGVTPGNTADNFRPITYLSQRYLSPWQDQPGNFALGFFRMWATAIDESEIRRTANVFLTRGDAPQSLLFNVQIERPCGSSLPSFTQYKDVFESGFKSWGEVRTHEDPVARVVVGWHQEDQLGYGALPSSFEAGRYARCYGIMPYTSTLARVSGVATVFDSSLHYDERVTGEFRQLHLRNLGLLNNFSPSQRWNGTLIADRLVLTGRGGSPKAFDGRVVTTLGFRGYRGGRPKLSSSNVAYHSPTEYTADEWVGVRVAYVAEGSSIVAFSEQSAVQILAAGGRPFFTVSDISPHPDPRVTSIVVCVNSAPAATREEALALPVFFTQGAMANEYVDLVQIIEKPRASAPQLDTTRSMLPNCSLSASAYGSLYLSGDDLVPDVVYYSDPGNPESLNTVVNRFVIEESSGDEIVSIQSIFGSLWAFKQNSIWRITQTASGVTADGIPTISHDLQKIASIGPVSSRSMVLVSIPDTGRTVLAFWTRNGPYLFDGINLDYIGWQIEGDVPFSWLDPASVVAVHDQSTREIAFLYESNCSCADEVCPAGRPGSAAVFNYRIGGWTFFTGILGTEAISADFSQELVLGAPAAIPGSLGGSTTIVAPRVQSRYLSLVGGASGHVYAWGTGVRSGVPDVGKPLDVVVTGSSGATIFFAVPLGPGWGPHELRGVWATIVSEDGERFFSFPISDNDSSSVVVEFSKCTSMPFQPSQGDLLHIGLTPVVVSWPWDQFESPANNKQMVRWSIWGDGQMFYRYATDWNESTFDLWRRVPFVERKRRHIELIRGNSDAFKFELMSLDPTFALDSHLFEASDTLAGNN